MTRFDDLDDDCLMALLDQLILDQLLKMLQVNKRLNRLATVKMQMNVKVISFDQMKLLYKKFSKCRHLGLINKNQVLSLSSKFNDLDYFSRPSEWQIFNEESRKEFVKVLSKCAGVKNIDFRHFLSRIFGVLLDVIRNCPDIECIKLTDVEESEWRLVLDLMGHKIIHFVKEPIYNQLMTKPSISDAKLLKMTALKCSNIKQIDWSTNELTQDFVSALKMLPKTCWIKLECSRINEDVINEVLENVDEFDTTTLDWSILAQRIYRLKGLKFYGLNDLIRSYDINKLREFQGVVFTSLKRLEFHTILNYDDASIKCVILSRFPSLEMLFLNASLTEIDYYAMFKKMPSVKKLKLFSMTNDNFNVPGSAIYQLKKLDIISIKIREFSTDWQPNEFLKQLEHYAYGICWLKKLVVQLTLNSTKFYKWEMMFVEKMKQLMMKQSRIEIVVINSKMDLNFYLC